jgi:glycosyltransferase involved in cell wall biosynthesis
MTQPSRSQSPLRILHIVLGSEPGGLSRYVIDLTCAMRERGHEITVGGDRGAAHAMFERAKVSWIDIPLKGGIVSFLKSATILKRHLRDHPVDVIHTHYRRATLLGRRIQRPRPRPRHAGPERSEGPDLPRATTRTPLLYTLHLSHINITGPRRWLSDFGDHTHAASEDARQWLIREARVPSERITLIPHGIDPQRFPHADSQTKRNAKVALGLDPHALVASYVGRFEHPKNEAWLLDLACATRGQMPNLHVVLVGGGPDEPALRDRIDSQNLHDRVHLFGHRDDPASVYHASDLLLLPSAREGFSLVCAEAMSAGVPVLRTRTSGTAELIIENVTGRSVEIDHDKFIDAAITMLRDPAALARMGTAAARHVRDNFTFDRQVERTIELYRRLSKPEVHRGR